MISMTAIQKPLGAKGVITQLVIQHQPCGWLVVLFMFKRENCSNNVVGLKGFQAQCEHQVGCPETTHCFLQTKDNDALMSFTLYCPLWNTAPGRKPTKPNCQSQHLQYFAVTPIPFTLNAGTCVKCLCHLTHMSQPHGVSKVPSQREKGNEEMRKTPKRFADRPSEIIKCF